MIRLIHGDAIEEMNKLIVEGIAIDAIITDPPYNVSQQNNFNTIKDKNGEQKYGSIDFGEWDKNFDERAWLETALKLLKNGGNIVIFCSWKQLSTYVSILEDNKCLVKNMLQWVKPNSAPKNRDRLYIVNYEVAIWATKGKGWTFNRQDEKRQLSQFTYPFVGGKEKTKHTTQKPFRLMSDLIKIHTNVGDTILDPFFGSGTTAIAADNLRREFVGMEIDDTYYEIAVNRLREAQ